MFKLLRKLSKKDVLYAIICIILVAFQVWLDLKLPDYMSEITRLVQTSGSHMRDILTAGGKMMLCAVGSLISAIIVGYFAALISASFSRKLRRDIFNHTLTFGMNEIKNFQTSSLITRTTNDVTQIEMVIAMGLQMLIKAPIMAVWAITKIVNKRLEWSALTGSCGGILLITIFTLMIIVLPRFKIVQKLIDKINGVTRENLTGIRVIHAFNAEDFQLDRFEDVNSTLTRTQLFNQRCFAILNPVMNLVMHFLTLGIYFIGAYLIMNASMVDKIALFGDMVVFTSYGMQVIMSFLMLAMIFMMWPRAQVSAGRINEVLDQKTSLKDGTLSEGKENDKGTIQFNNVSFKYPDASGYLLKDISFSIKEGETVAFIGSTGSGKSTLINLIPRFYDVSEGEILVDGVNVKDYKLDSLHHKIGYVPQKAFLFNDSVYNNVAYGDNGKETTQKRVNDAIIIAQADEFVSKMEGGVDAHIARGGTNISGGQKQRLAIARAIAYDPEIYIFDDSFSALDYKTDAILRKELKEYTKNATTLIVAQRIGTIMNADKIIVLDRGKCVGIGRHEELLQNCDVYKEIALSQLSKEELDHA